MAEEARLDRWGAALLAAATAALILAWPGWHLGDAVPEDSYPQEPELFAAAAESYVDLHRVGERDGVPLVRPPPDAHVPVVARRFEFWPALELQAGRTYHLHVAAVDTVHSVVAQGREYALVPGQVQVITVVPGEQVTLQCGEYCGLGHNRMRGLVSVVAPD
ncbi:MAG: quinol oxidase [Magnetospirillum sp.]|nr:quinol oxidase [Magnetospirillum sp.]